MKNILKIIPILFFFSCLVAKRNITDKENLQCIENLYFKKVFFENITTIDSLINKNQSKDFNKSLNFISNYAHVSYESTLNYGRLYPFGIYEKDRNGWIEWYEKNKCSNIQFKKK